MSSESHDIQKEVRAYVIVFVALLFLTIVTVTVSYLKLNMVAAITLALMIATVKASLVACYFMHLISEKKLIYAVLILTVIFFAAVLLIPLAGAHDILRGSEHVS